MKTNLDKFFKGDEDAEKNGVWMNITDGTGFLIKRLGGANAKELQAKLTKKQKPYAFQIQKKTMDPELEKRLYIEVFVDVAIVDWKGVEIDGAPAPFSKEAAVKLLVEMPDLANALFTHAEDANIYRVEVVGNS